MLSSECGWSHECFSDRLSASIIELKTALSTWARIRRSPSSSSSSSASVLTVSQPGSSWRQLWYLEGERRATRSVEPSDSILPERSIALSRTALDAPGFGLSIVESRAREGEGEAFECSELQTPESPAWFGDRRSAVTVSSAFWSYRRNVCGGSGAPTCPECRRRSHHLRADHLRARRASLRDPRSTSADGSAG